MALDAQFNAPGSMAAVFEPLTGDPIPVRTIRSQPDATASFGAGDIIQASDVFLLRAIEPLADGTSVAIEPIEGAVIVIEAGSFALSSDIRIDAEGMTWSCGAGRL